MLNCYLIEFELLSYSVVLLQCFFFRYVEIAFCLFYDAKIVTFVIKSNKNKTKSEYNAVKYDKYQYLCCCIFLFVM